MLYYAENEQLLVSPWFLISKNYFAYNSLYVTISHFRKVQILNQNCVDEDIKRLSKFGKFLL
jgi:hypothetical protein